jgi:uncharacterized protein YuzE
MTKWTYDPAIDAAYIEISPREPVTVRTIELTGIHVMLDVDLDGNVLGIELLPGFGGTVQRLNLTHHLKEEPQ